MKPLASSVTPRTNMTSKMANTLNKTPTRILLGLALSLPDAESMTPTNASAKLACHAIKASTIATADTTMPKTLNVLFLAMSIERAWDGR